VHVGGTLVVPRLDKAVGVAVDVAEVDEVDLLAEVADGLGDVRAHRGEVALAESDAVVLAVVDVEDAVVVLDAGDDAGTPRSSSRGGSSG